MHATLPLRATSDFPPLGGRPNPRDLLARDTKGAVAPASVAV